jgi:RHS repeat-associated protein
LFAYDAWNLLAVLSSPSSVLQSFMWGLDLSGSIQGAGGVGGLLEVNDTVNGVHFAAYDGNGNVAGLVKAADGTSSAVYEYGPFGEVIRATGPMAKANPFRFSTKFQDDETDLLCYPRRYYNAATGRWLSRDPIDEQGGLNLYGFVGNNSVGVIDPLGLDYYIYSTKAWCGVPHWTMVGDDGNGKSYEIDIVPVVKKWWQISNRLCGKGTINYIPRNAPATNFLSGTIVKHVATTTDQDKDLARKAKGLDGKSVVYCLCAQDCRSIEACCTSGQTLGQRNLKALLDMMNQALDDVMGSSGENP